MRPRDLAIVTEALGIGVTFQAMLDPEDVPWSLNGDLDASEIDARNAPYLALARLLRLPLIELQAAETEPTAEGEVPG